MTKVTRKNSSSRTTAVLIVAAGRGVRAGGGIPKQYRHLLGLPLLRHSALAFLGQPGIDQVLAVIHPDDRALHDQALQGLPVMEPAHGGASRQDSVRLGLEHLAALPSPPSHVLIHDAARPFVSASVIAKTLAAIAESKGAVVAVPVADTMKREAAGFVTNGPDRSGLWRAQTPQAFELAAILEAHRKMSGRNDFTDDASVAEAAGINVVLVKGEEENFKVTEPQDFDRATAHLLSRLADVRTGSGFDVHVLEKKQNNRPLMICGVDLPGDLTLAGHSDADVGLHALTDAILGAISEGDIGQHFPPSDEKWRGAASWKFLDHAAALVKSRGGVIAHVDVTIICERPKIGPHREAMRLRIAEILGIAIERVSVKATTTEKLGFTGRGEGIAAQAICTVRLPSTP